MTTVVFPQQSLEQVGAERWGQSWNSGSIQSATGLATTDAEWLSGIPLDLCQQSGDDLDAAYQLALVNEPAGGWLAGQRDGYSALTSDQSDPATPPSADGATTTSEPLTVSQDQFQNACTSGLGVKEVIQAVFGTSSKIWLHPLSTTETACHYVFVVDFEGLEELPETPNFEVVYSLSLERLQSDDDVLSATEHVDELVGGVPDNIEVVSVERLSRNQTTGSFEAVIAADLVVVDSSDPLGHGPDSEIVLSTRVVQKDGEALAVTSRGLNGDYRDAVIALVHFFGPEFLAAAGRSPEDSPGSGLSGFDPIPESWLK